jgi:hypothetical protein
MEAFQERVIQEKKELDVKIESLATFINGNRYFESLPEAERFRLYAQHRVMVDYSAILGERIAAFT